MRPCYGASTTRRACGLSRLRTPCVGSAPAPDAPKRPSPRSSYQYARSLVWLDDLSDERDPHSYDLCQRHTARLSVPNGWRLEDRRAAPPAGVQRRRRASPADRAARQPVGSATRAVAHPALRRAPGDRAPGAAPRTPCWLWLGAWFVGQLLADRGGRRVGAHRPGPRRSRLALRRGHCRLDAAARGARARSAGDAAPAIVRRATSGLSFQPARPASASRSACSPSSCCCRCSTGRSRRAWPGTFSQHKIAAARQGPVRPRARRRLCCCWCSWSWSARRSWRSWSTAACCKGRSPAGSNEVAGVVVVAAVVRRRPLPAGGDAGPVRGRSRARRRARCSPAVSAWACSRTWRSTPPGSGAALPCA